MPDFFRIVSLRRGKVQAAEFRLRPGENGLSLFKSAAEIPLNVIVDAVRACGKRGDLAGAVLPEKVLRSLHMKAVPIPGGTPLPTINALHHETRFRWWRKLWLLLQGRSPYDYFNGVVAPRLCALAVIQEV